MRFVVFLLLTTAFFNVNLNSQDSLSLNYRMNNPIMLYKIKSKLKQEDLRRNLKVSRHLSFKIINSKRDTFKYCEYDGKGKVIKVYYTDTKRKRLAEIKERNKRNPYLACHEVTSDDIRKFSNTSITSLNIQDTSNIENGELITRDSSGKIIWRLKNTFMEQDLIFIHESIDEETQKPTFRNVMRLDDNLNIISGTCFDGARKKTFSRIYKYDENGNRIKGIKYTEGELDPEIELYEFYSNGLLKKETKRNTTTEYEYEYN